MKNGVRVHPSFISTSDGGCHCENDVFLGLVVYFRAVISSFVPQFILKNYGENPDNYNEQLKKLETLRQVRAP